jgi:hypothetical protein
MSATIFIRYVTSNLPTSQLSSSLKLIDIIVAVQMPILSEIRCQMNLISLCPIVVPDCDL